MSDDWRPTADPACRRVRAAVYAAIRGFFAERGVLEVETPLLSQAANTDPNIESFEVEDHGHRWFLRTSPEFAMKRMLAAESGPIYELGRVFRRGESGRWHNPEFTMLEWYRPGYDHHALIEEVFDLIQAAAAATNGRRFEQRKTSYVKAFSTITNGIDPLAADASELNDFLRSRGWYEGTLSRRDALDLIVALGVRELPGRDGLLAIHDYPVELAALAAVSTENPGIAERFEVYLDGQELANGYHELTDPEALLSRFEAENRQRAMNRQKVLPHDERLIEAQRHGLPACAGVALGVDRLVAALAGVESINHVIEFPSDRA